MIDLGEYNQAQCSPAYRGRLCLKCAEGYGLTANHVCRWGSFTSHEPEMDSRWPQLAASAFLHPALRAQRQPVKSACASWLCFDPSTPGLLQQADQDMCACPTHAVHACTWPSMQALPLQGPVYHLFRAGCLPHSSRHPHHHQGTCCAAVLLPAPMVRATAATSCHSSAGQGCEVDTTCSCSCLLLWPT